MHLAPKFLVVVAITLAPATALPCSFDPISLAENGPARWDGRSDVPSNWVFVTKDIPQDTETTWWSRELPAGDIQPLEIERVDGLARIFPRERFRVGQDYEVFSAQSFNDEGVPERVYSGTFTIVEAKDTPPTAPAIVGTKFFNVPAPTEEITCERPRPAGYATTTVSYFAPGPVALLLLRDSDTDWIVDHRQKPSRQSDLSGPRLETTGVFNFTIEAYDAAGNVAATSGSIVVDRSPSCAQSGFPLRGSPNFLAGLCLSFLLLFRRRTHLTKNV